MQKSISATKYAIVVSQYNESITEKLLQGALKTLAENQIDRNAVEVARVPGAWEIPLAAKWLADVRPGFAGIIALGVVIKGETTHDEHINRFVTMSLGQISLDSGVPIALGVLTCNTLQQAVERAGGKAGNKGEEAAQAVLEMASLRARFTSQLAHP
ncbi:MAG: 6,7-dimethyl-8-ribityllumazine synthase [Pirellulaceae bacterium]